MNIVENIEEVFAAVTRQTGEDDAFFLLALHPANTALASQSYTAHSGPIVGLAIAFKRPITT